MSERIDRSTSNANETFIKRFDALPDEKLVERMWEGDDDVWRYILMRSVVPVLRRPVLAAIMRDRRRSDIDVLGAIFERLIAKKALKNFKFGCPIVYWVRFWVAKEVYQYCEKNDAPVSDEAYLAVLNDSVAPESNWDRIEEANECYKRLYRKSPKKAKVLYLRAVEGRSAKDIMKLLGLTSEANVNQLFSRACKEMCTYREELSAPVEKTGKEVAYELS